MPRLLNKLTTPAPRRRLSTTSAGSTIYASASSMALLVRAHFTRACDQVADCFTKVLDKTQQFLVGLRCYRALSPTLLLRSSLAAREGQRSSPRTPQVSTAELKCCEASSQDASWREDYGFEDYGFQV
eukprot:42921-Pleurochrysis_carterae.AAC.1